jgi:hypothetical protein
MKGLIKNNPSYFVHVFRIFAYFPNFSLQNVVVFLMAKGSFWLGEFAGFILIVLIGGASGMVPKPGLLPVSLVHEL